jgi:phosphatidylglycerophosphate synthase
MTKVITEKRYCLTAFLTDALTLSRLGIAGLILWLGWTAGRAAFPEAILLVTLGWITDAADGFIARHSECPTRLGTLDYPIDASLTWASFIFIALAGFIPPAFVGAYTLLAAAVTLWFRRKAVLVLFMRGVDLIVFYFAVRYELIYTLPLLVWLLFLAWFHRARLRRDVPRWLRELSELFRK